MLCNHKLFIIVAIKVNTIKHAFPHTYQRDALAHTSDIVACSYLIFDLWIGLEQNCCLLVTSRLFGSKYNKAISLIYTRDKSHKGIALTKST